MTDGIGMDYATPNFVHDVEESLGEKSLPIDMQVWNAPAPVVMRDDPKPYRFPFYSDYIDGFLASPRTSTPLQAQPLPTAPTRVAPTQERHLRPTVDDDGQSWCPKCGNWLFVHPQGRKTLYRCSNVGACEYKHVGWK